MLTKKDFEEIARTVLEARRDLKAGLDPMEVLEVGLGGYFASQNPRFDRSRFLAACRGEDSTDSAGRRVRYSVQS